MVSDKEIENMGNELLKSIAEICEGHTIYVKYDVLASVFSQYHTLIHENIKEAETGMAKIQDNIIQNWMLIKNTTSKSNVIN